MNFVVEFYKSLDTLNLIIFWGIIIVVTLLLIFSIIILNKNKKLKRIISLKEREEIISKEQNLSEEIPIIKHQNNDLKKEELILDSSSEIKNIENNQTIEEEPKFIAEEHVVTYSENTSFPPVQKPTNDFQEDKTNHKTIEKKEEIKIPTGPYQRNVLREMSLNQTSPIGIVKSVKKYDIEIDKAKELHDSLNIEKEYEQKETKDIRTENYQNNNYNINNKTLDIPKTSKEKYLEEVSRKLASTKQKDEIDRTEYEMQQEEEAIISYKELMEKKDSIRIIDEEEAVISIEELMRKKAQQEKLYSLTEEEENDKFINELKNFRNDL